MMNVFIFFSLICAPFGLQARVLSYRKCTVFYFHFILFYVRDRTANTKLQKSGVNCSIPSAGVFSFYLGIMHVEIFTIRSNVNTSLSMFGFLPAETYCTLRCSFHFILKRHEKEKKNDSNSGNFKFVAFCMVGYGCVIVR